MRDDTPVQFSKDVADRICESIASGLSLRKTCEQPGMPTRQAVFKWLREGSDASASQELKSFVSQYVRAREDQTEAQVDEMQDIAADVGTQSDHIAKAKLRIDVTRWNAGKMKPKKYGDKSQLELTGKDGGPIELTNAKATLLAGVVPDPTGGGTDPKN